VRRTSSAVVIFGPRNTLGHSPKARLPCVQIPIVEKPKVCTVSGILWGGDFRLDPVRPLQRPKGGHARLFDRYPDLLHGAFAFRLPARYRA
jgi:hypothetical protein